MMKVIRSVSPDGSSVAQIIITGDAEQDDERIRAICERFARQDEDDRRLRGRIFLAGCGVLLAAVGLTLAALGYAIATH
ncbi:hypothetical protein [uncultured Desulfovibrio sp.]|uniref:hypothetical protein n=1 Tax=uncultured Desulfovibrio sp. TaxID=167968 RepID=UPI0026032803|nr:hypothetical protein [uncultured Desulfovibrio sp.]